MDEWFNNQIDELYKAVTEEYRHRKTKAVGRLKIDQEEIKRIFFKEPVSLIDEAIINGCWKKILDNKNAEKYNTFDSFYFVG